MTLSSNNIFIYELFPQKNDVFSRCQKKCRMHQQTSTDNVFIFRYGNINFIILELLVTMGCCLFLLYLKQNSILHIAFF